MRFLSSLIFVLPFILSCTSTTSRMPARDATDGVSPVVFLSDFGIDGDSVAIVKGVVLGISPTTAIIDLTHQVPAFSVREAARLLNNTAAYFPKGTVFISLVDRHASGPRRGIVLKSKKGQYFLQPDNGLVTLVAQRDGVEEVREIQTLSSPHAWRDVYAPLAARLSRREDFSLAGPVTAKFTQLDLKTFKIDAKGIKGEVVALDAPFGNLITNITSINLLNAGYALGEKVQFALGSKDFQVPFVKTFDDVPVGEMLTYIDSTDHVAIAINQGNFAAKNKIKVGTKVLISKPALKPGFRPEFKPEFRKD